MLPGLSVSNNMEPKLAYLEQELNMTRAALRDHVLRIPAILAYSLDKRYRPRVEACRAAGVDAAYVLTAAPLTDEYFYERLETMRGGGRRRDRVVTGVQHRVLRRRQRPPGHGAWRAAPRHRLHVHGVRHAVGEKFSEHAYRHGVVVVRCPGCGNDHLIADNLGFFEDDWTLEDMLRARGDSVETLDDDNLAEGVDADLLKRLVEGRRDK